jgi:NitT/TauT family transport system substrate-binding protein
VKKIFLILISIALAGAAGAEGKKESSSIRIAVMPDAGALPLFLMEGVETVPFMSAKERDSAMQLGELDGMMSDMVSVVAFHQKGMTQRVLSLTESRFMIVGHPDFSIDSLWSVGISENTIIEFMVDQLASGRELDKVAIPQVPVRMEMLRNGKIPLACLTDAMAWPLLSQGFPIVRDQKGSGLEPAVLVLTENFIKESPERVEQLKRDWNKAVESINSSPGEYRSLLQDKLRLPSDEEDPYPVPLYRPITLPSRETVDKVLIWFEEKYGLEKSVSYEELIVP